MSVVQYCAVQKYIVVLPTAVETTFSQSHCHYLCVIRLYFLCVVYNTSCCQNVAFKYYPA